MWGGLLGNKRQGDFFCGSKKCWDFFGGHEFFWKKKKNPRGQYRGTCVLGNKRQDRGKKFQGARNFGGDFLGKCKKRVEKLFWGSVGGAVNPNKIYGEIFWKNVKEKNVMR